MLGHSKVQIEAKHMALGGFRTLTSVGVNVDPPICNAN
jgi:hypothetical protein